MMQLNLNGGDVIIVDDMVDTGVTIQSLAQRMSEAGARDIIVCASHGLFSEKAMEVIEASKVSKILVTDSLPLPKHPSSKIVQVPLAPFLADMILTEHFRSVRTEDDTFEDE
jgi:ribose-phosphate pyrophosphokinase